MGKIGLDSNIFLCVLLPEATKTDKQNVAGSEKLLGSLSSSNIGVTSSIVFAEVAWAFLREEKDGEEMEGAKYVLKTMEGLKIISVSDEIAWKAGRLRRLYYSRKNQISYQDTIYLVTSISENVDALYTTDPDLLNISEPEVPIIEAKDVL